jgi:hypothetical protein
VTLRLWTARFANRALAQHPAAKVGIALGAPKWPLPYHLHPLAQLAPAGWMLHLEDEAKFAIAYGRKLDRLGIIAIKVSLEEVAAAAGVDTLVLLCYERIDTGEAWCHRRIFAEWWSARTGEVVAELPEA